MPRPKSARKAADAGSAFIRFSADEYDLIKRAMTAQSKGVIGGNTISLASFSREIVVKEAKRILGEK